MIFIKRMKNIIKKILKEDDWDWARDIKPMFNKKNQPREGDVLICLPGYSNDSMSMEDPQYAGSGYYEGRIIVVADVDVHPDNEEEKQLVIWPDVDESMRWWNKEEECYSCGVYGGYLNYYSGNLNESEENDWDWFKTDLINPWESGYDGVHFDIKPTFEDVNELIEMALGFGISNANLWIDSIDNLREDDIDDIMYYFNKFGHAYLLIDRHKALSMSESIIGSWERYKFINYSMLTNKTIKESEEDLDWIKDIPTGIELKPNTFYYFDPALTWGDEVERFASSILNSEWIKNWLLNISPKYHDKKGITYFVTSSTLEGRISGWCTTDTHRDRIGGYPGKEAVDARKEFNL